MAGNIEGIIAQTFLDIANGLETGSFGKRPKIALTGMGSEHGEENSMAGALMAQAKGIDVVYIGSIQDDRVTCVKAVSYTHLDVYKRQLKLFRKDWKSFLAHPLSKI